MRRIGALALLLTLWSCGRAPTTSVCVGGAVLRDGQCEAQRAPIHFLPFRAGVETKIQQAFHGYMSHKDDLAYAVDLQCTEGTPVTASRGARVWAVKEDSNTGCADPVCLDQANYVILDHGDGTYSEYYHLRYMGALVEEGEHVCAGEVIGICGNTGYSTGPHLHFALTDVSRRTVPFQFFEAHVEQDFGFPIPDDKLTSRNRLRTRCPDHGYSVIAPSAFAHQGIVLDEELPSVVTDRGPRVVSGWFYGDHPKISIHRKSLSGGGWLEECVEVDARGRFEFEMDWPLERFAPGTYWFMLTGATKDCLAPGWAWSYKVRVR